MDAGAEVIVLDDSSDASSGCEAGASAATTPAASPAVPRRPAQPVGYASAVEAALAMADGCVTTGKTKKKEKRAAPAPPLLPWKAKQQQTAAEKRPQAVPKARRRETRRPLESSRPRRRFSSSSSSSSSDLSSSSSSRTGRRPNFRSSGGLARSEVSRRPKSSSGGTAGRQVKERRPSGVTKPRQVDQRRRTPAAPQGASKKAVEVVDLLSSSSGSSIGRNSRSSSISSLTSSDEDLPAPAPTKSGKKRLVLNERVLGKGAPRPVLYSGQHTLSESAFRPSFSSRETNQAAHGDKRKRVLPGMRRESGGSKRDRAPESQSSKKKMTKKPSTTAPLSLLSTSSSSASSSPASSPRAVPARKSATTPSTPAATQAREGETDAFGRQHCRKSVSSGTPTIVKAAVPSPASTSSQLSPSPSPRKKRRVANRFNTDSFALDELQAQDRELAWIRLQRKQAQSRPHPSKPAVQKQKASREVIYVDDHSDACSAAHSEEGQHSDGPRDRVKLKPNASIVAEQRPAVAFNSVVLHPTSYRGIHLDEAPINILAMCGIECTEPFQSDCDHPITFYDETGTLASQCSILESFGKPTQCISSVFPSEAAKPQSDVTRSVGALVTAHLPIIRSCHQRKVQAILAEARQQVAAYQAALKTHERDRPKNNVTSHPLPRTTMEKQAVKQLKSTEFSCSFSAGSVSFQIGRGDSFVREKSVSSLIQINRVEKIQPLRKYTTSIGLRANYREEDDPILRYTAIARPSGADNGAEGDVAEKYGLEIGNVADEEVVEYVLRLVVGRLGDSEQVFQALKSELDFPQAYTAYSELKKLHDSRQRAIARLDRVEELSHGVVDAGVIAITNLMEQSSLSRASRVKALKLRLQPPIRNLESSFVDSLVDSASAGMASLGLRATDTYSELVDVYSGSFCRMCYTYACHEHGGDHPLPARRVDPMYPRVRSGLGTLADGRCGEGGRGSTVDDVVGVDFAGSAERRGESGSTLQLDVEGDVDMEGNGSDGSAPQERRRTKAQMDPSEYVEASHVSLVAEKMQSFLSTGSACSQQCWKNGNLIPTISRPKALSAAEVGITRKLRETMGDNACLLAAVIGSASCMDLHAFITTEKHSEGQGLADARSGRRMRNWKGGRRLGGSNHELLQRTRNQRLQDRGADNHEYQPCAHEGMCDSTGCSCMKRDHMCEKACACSRDCPNRFEGCACQSDECQTSKCPCFAALRECDPDVCLSCGASEVAVVGFTGANQHGSSVRSTCGNVNVVRSKHKSLGKSYSSIHGYGMYAREAIAANEFVYEYTGAMLSQDEAERRGLIYDRMEMSYLFDLNADAVLDALRCGNKSKFINHDGETPNCTAKVVSVCGVHHITIWAVRDIAIGEELVFDYGYKRSVGPDWSQKRAASKDKRG